MLQQQQQQRKISMISASQELAYYLRLYGQQDFPLSVNTDESNQAKKGSLAATLNEFANYVDQVNFMLIIV